ncbi:hypothetical protein IFM89_022345 [Coptis chinensis]|uniref:Protein kinase domain-containing protein n=1 Tax=Coptis chinensis TaxID=261450 RepID=A0A835M166_9MAGN|nr:hypothetical protein IFM89_022345 [Coptis chinensis]
MTSEPIIYDATSAGGINPTTGRRLQIAELSFTHSRTACSVITGASSFDSDLEKRKKKGHPLPRPSFSSAPNNFVHEQAAAAAVVLGSGSGSVSVSSVSSSGSSDEPISHDFGFTSHYRNTCCDHRGRTENKFSPRARSPKAMSPLHHRMSVMNLESGTGNQEDGRSPCHPLPLPPGSPTKSSCPSSISSSGGNENSQCFRSKWKKGKLLGRGTFGHVYVGFNREKIHYQFLEYVTGGSIHKLLQEYGPFGEPVIQNYTRQILLGLAYLHGRNTVHRDIKGANILVGPDGEIKLADFGMAKHVTSHTSILSFKGSPYWMAPEVIMNISGYSLAVDIWSLGCTILEMATSKPPWSQFEGVAAIFKIGNSKDIPEIPDHLSNDAKRFLKLCLQRDPSARPTAAQLLDHPFIRDQSATARVPKTNTVSDVFPSSSDGSRAGTAADFYSIKSRDGAYRVKPLVTSSRGLKNPRDGLRMNMSLPVSPSSSPLRQYGPAHRSCFLSPPPSYMLAGQSSYGTTDQLFMSSRQYMNYPTDQWVDIPQLRSQTPGGSPRAGTHF